MDARGKIFGARPSRRRLIVLLAALAVVAALSVFLARDRGSEQVDSWDTDYSPTSEVRQHTLADARQASHMNVTVYDEGGHPAYLGWSGGSEAMESFTEAVSGASPVAGEPDESFADLIVFYFRDGSTLATAYSRSRGLLSFEGGLYQPAGEIGTLILEGEERFN